MESESRKIISLPRIMIAAGSSGSGKTLITCALLQLLHERFRDLYAYKCGPDYIDPMFHKKVLGVESENLDSFFCEQEDLCRILCRNGKGHAVIEGVMGIYDGISPAGTEASCYEVAKLTGTPVVLVMDASGTGRTVISQIKGILADDEDGCIRGLILNRISPGFYERIKGVLERELQAAGFSRVQILGGIPFVKDIAFESRHLGLLLPDEIEDLKGRIERFSGVLCERIDTETVLGIMESAKELMPENGQEEDACMTAKDRMLSQGKPAYEHTLRDNGPVLAVAYDEAFCFYYRENLDLLQRAGLTIRYFSPLHDPHIPEDAAGLLLGGGYPELHLDALSNNHSMLSSIRQALDEHMPSIAECGGFMYLHRSVADRDGKGYALVGAVPGTCTYTGHAVRFGYLSLQADHGKAFDFDLSGMRGHEFHYYDSTCNGDLCKAV
ncbi:MAG: cobyrinate a,c-diamide synthase, partial [Lachnospiraceae bacterium]|nr:cobyrinate a,c-diamide synthase [Lachnospiraceae bacterium]